MHLLYANVDKYIHYILVFKLDESNMIWKCFVHSSVCNLQFGVICHNRFITFKLLFVMPFVVENLKKCIQYPNTPIYYTKVYMQTLKSDHKITDSVYYLLNYFIFVHSNLSTEFYKLMVRLALRSLSHWSSKYFINYVIPW